MILRIYIWPLTQFNSFLTEHRLGWMPGRRCIINCNNKVERAQGRIQGGRSGAMPSPEFKKKRLERGKAGKWAHMSLILSNFGPILVWGVGA